MEAKQFRVHSSDDGARLDRWCQRILGRAPNSIYQKALRKGLIKLEGKKADGNDRVKTGQTITVRMALGETDKVAGAREKKVHEIDAKTEAEVRGWVIHKDDDIIVINKPAGLPVQGGSKVGKHLDGLLPALQYDAHDLPRLVHRLDKDTSGVLVLARHVKAASELQRAFANKKLQKIYLALVVGVPQPRSGEIESNMDKLKRGEHSRELVRSVEEAGKRAVTRYSTRESLAGKLALVELEPITGRTHQLRVHASEAGWPIVGDGKYSSRDADSVLGLQQKLHLHAWRLSVPELFGDDAREFEAPLPKHMRESCERLGLSHAD
jgi:23S rRNA pseudouridine955/2504/2580 synthase